MINARRPVAVARAAVALASIVLVAACMAPVGHGAGEGSAIASPGGPTGSAGNAPESASPSRLVPQVSIPPVAVNLATVPASIVAEVRRQAAALTGVDPDAIVFTRAQATVWPNTALGCPASPGSAGADVLVPGFWLVLRAGDRVLDFRATQAGLVRLCENPLGPGSTTGSS